MPRDQLRDVRLTVWEGPGSWAKSVELVVAAREPINLCWGYNEGEIRDAYEALKSCLNRPTIPPGG